MSKIIKFDREAKEKLQAGIDKVNKAVSVTMGPFGRNVLIEKEHGQVVSTKDGVTVAKTITLEDPIENMAATVIKQAAQKTVDAAGDGTTTSTVLAHAIASQALEATSYASINATQVKRGIEEAVTVYGNEVYAYQLRDNYLSLEGASSFIDVNNSIFTPSMDGIVRLSQQYGEEAGVRIRYFDLPPELGYPPE